MSPLPNRGNFSSAKNIPVGIESNQWFQIHKGIDAPPLPMVPKHVTCVSRERYHTEIIARAVRYCISASDHNLTPIAAPDSCDGVNHAFARILLSPSWAFGLISSREYETVSHPATQ